MCDNLPYKIQMIFKLKLNINTFLNTFNPLTSLLLQMVFGWGKKKSEEPSKENTKQKEISLSEIPKIAQNLLDLRYKQTVSEIKIIRNQISPLIKELANIVHNLEKDNLNVDDIDKHLRIIVVRGKKQVIDIIKKESSNLPETSTFDDVLEMSNILNQKLKKIGDVLGRQTRVIHIFAKKYAEELKEILADMNSFNGEIQNLIRNFQSTQSNFEEIIGLLDELKKLQDDTVEKNHRISQLKKDLLFSQEKTKELENTIEKIKSDSLYAKFLETKKNLSSFDDTKHQIKDEIAIHFTKISRPLSRYEYASSLDKEQKSLLLDLINDPFRVLIPSNKDSIIVILENVRKGISSGSISVKDVDKAMGHITEVEEILDTLIERIHDFLEKKKKIENEIKSFDNTKLFSLENQLEKISEQKNDIEAKISVFSKDISENSENLPTKISQIEKLLKKFSNTEYIITKTSEN